jgi:hypothetical protein
MQAGCVGIWHWLGRVAALQCERGSAARRGMQGGLGGYGAGWGAATADVQASDGDCAGKRRPWTDRCRRRRVRRPWSRFMRSDGRRRRSGDGLGSLGILTGQARKGWRYFPLEAKKNGAIIPTRAAKSRQKSSASPQFTFLKARLHIPEGLLRIRGVETSPSGTWRLIPEGSCIS